jgi:hypothetical protein
VAELCWNYNAQLRPTAEEVQRMLGNEMGEDARPPTDAEDALFEVGKRGRSAEAKVDYANVSAIVKRVSI